MKKVRTYKDVELLPPFCEVDFVLEVVGVADVDERQVLKNKSDVRNTWRPEIKFIDYKLDFLNYHLFKSQSNLALSAQK